MLLSTIHNEELIFQFFPVGKLILFLFWIGLDVVRSTGNLSRICNYILLHRFKAVFLTLLGLPYEMLSAIIFG